MSDDIQEPLVRADIDLSKIDGFMLDTVRLLGSELVAISTGEEFKAAVLLWARSWHQKPAASLPDDDRVLASFAMVPLSRWKKVKAVALRGFVKCSDGRLYHKVLAEDAVRAWGRVTQRREAIRKRYGKAPPEPTSEATAVDDPKPSPKNGGGYETPTVDGTGRRRDVDGDGTVTGRYLSSTSPQSTDDARERPPGSYAFVGSAIRLKASDMAAWRKSFHAIPDLDAELRAIDAKLVDQPPADGRWFGMVSGWLRTKHEKLLAKAKTSNGPPQPASGHRMVVDDAAHELDELAKRQRATATKAAS